MTQDPEAANTRTPDLSIVVPAYNEAHNLLPRLARLAAFLAGQPYTYEVLVIDDGSEDDTAEIVEGFAAGRPSFRLLRNPHRGKAYAVTTGVMAARGRNVLLMDMDLATDLSHISEFVEALEAGEGDILIASREAPGAERKGTPASRRVMAKGFNLIVRTLLLPGLKDTQCGFKAFRAEVARELFSNLLVFADDRPVQGPLTTAFDVELLVMARHRGYRIREMPVRWRHRESRRVSALRDPYRMLVQVLKVWRNEKQGRYRPGAPRPGSALVGARQDGGEDVDVDREQEAG